MELSARRKAGELIGSLFMDEREEPPTLDEVLAVKAEMIHLMESMSEEERENLMEIMEVFVELEMQARHNDTRRGIE